MPDVYMPRLSDTMQEGTVSQWLKKVGDKVAKGDILAEIETDKATMELEAYDDGVLERIVVDAGGTVPIGETIAVIGGGSGTPSGNGKPAASTDAAAPATAAGPASQAGEATPATPAADTAPAAPVSPAPAAPTAAPAPTAPAGPAGAPQADGGAAPGQVKASPLARAIAREHGLDLATVQGSGPGGRIVRADVESAVAQLGTGAAPTAPRPPSTAAPSAPSAPYAAALAPQGPDVEELPLNNVRRITGQRMAESKRNAPHFYLNAVVDAAELVAFRSQLNAGLESLAGDEGPLRVSLNDLIVKACARALRAHPAVNVSFVQDESGDKLLQQNRVHIGIAVALPDGLIVPVIRDADLKPVSAIAAESKDLAGRARAGRLKPDEFTGSTFSVSNLGMFGVDHFSAVVNPPEAAILAVGAARAEPVVRDGQVVAGTTMKITLSIDHRAVDGATGARFLADLVALLEHPAAMLA